MLALAAPPVEGVPPIATAAPPVLTATEPPTLATVLGMPPVAAAMAPPMLAMIAVLLPPVCTAGNADAAPPDALVTGAAVAMGSTTSLRE